MRVVLIGGTNDGFWIEDPKHRNRVFMPQRPYDPGTVQNRPSPGRTDAEVSREEYRRFDCHIENSPVTAWVIAEWSDAKALYEVAKRLGVDLATQTF